MAKRFISTDLFNDSWFMELSTNSKLFYVYLLTNCDNAGIIDLNIKLAEFQTGIPSLNKNFSKYLECLKLRLLHLKDNYYFLPKFVPFQYPNGLSESVKPQKQVIEKLKKFDLLDENLTINIQLNNSMDTIKDIYKETVVVVNTDKDKKEEKEKLNKKKSFKIPTVREIIEYGIEKGYKLDGKKIHDYYTELDWHDSSGKKIRNWKSKVLVNWCRDEFKIGHTGQNAYTPAAIVMKREQKAEVEKKQHEEKKPNFDPSKLPKDSMIGKMLGKQTTKRKSGLKRITDV